MNGATSGSSLLPSPEQAALWCQPTSYCGQKATVMQTVSQFKNRTGFFSVPEGPSFILTVSEPINILR